MNFFHFKESNLNLIYNETPKYTLASLRVKLTKAGLSYDPVSQSWHCAKEERPNQRFNKKIYGIIGLLVEYEVPFERG